MEPDAEVERQGGNRFPNAAERIDEAELRIPLLDASTFDAEVLNRDEPSLVVFFLQTCPTCHALIVRLHRLAASAGHVGMFRVDCELSNELAIRHRISNVPALLVFSGGRERNRLEGLIPESDLQVLLDSLQ